VNIHVSVDVFIFVFFAISVLFPNELVKLFATDGKVSSGGLDSKTTESMAEPPLLLRARKRGWL
jgi:hypothetical protein